MADLLSKELIEAEVVRLRKELGIANSAELKEKIKSGRYTCPSDLFATVYLHRFEIALEEGVEL